MYFIKEDLFPKGSFKASVKTSLSRRHLKSAFLFAEKAYELEKNYKNEFDSKSPDEKFKIVEEYFAHTSSSVILSVSFLEARINEFYDCVISETPDNILKKLKDDSPECVEIFQSFFSVMFEKGDKPDNISILKKYDIALALFNKELFDKGENPYQDVYLLIGLRNSLVHYKPESITTGSELPLNEQHKFEKQLKQKFALNPFYENYGNPFYPDKCLSCGCAHWSIISCYNFVESFHSKLGLESNYGFVIEELKFKIRS